MTDSSLWQTKLSRDAIIEGLRRAIVTGVTISVDGGTLASSGWTRHERGWRLFA